MTQLYPPGVHDKWLYRRIGRRSSPRGDGLWPPWLASSRESRTRSTAWRWWRISSSPATAWDCCPSAGDQCRRQGATSAETEGAADGLRRGAARPGDVAAAAHSVGSDAPRRRVRAASPEVAAAGPRALASQAASDRRRARLRVSVDHRWPQSRHCKWTSVPLLLSRYCQCVAQFLVLWHSPQRASWLQRGHGSQARQP
jgi:hypothetical protein